MTIQIFTDVPILCTVTIEMNFVHSIHRWNFIEIPIKQVEYIIISFD